MTTTLVPINKHAVVIRGSSHGLFAGAGKRLYVVERGDPTRTIDPDDVTATETLIDVFEDYLGTTPAAQPLISDSAGRWPYWIEADQVDLYCPDDPFFPIEPVDAGGDPIAPAGPAGGVLGGTFPNPHLDYLEAIEELGIARVATGSYYGAVGDGVALDGARIQAMIDDLETDGGGVGILNTKSADFLINDLTDGLVIPTGVIIKLVGMGPWYQQYTKGTRIRRTTGSGPILICDGSDHTTGVGDVDIRDMSFDGGGRVAPGVKLSAMQQMWMDRVEVVNIENVGLELDGIYNADIGKIWIHTCGLYNAFLSQDFAGLKISSATVDAGGTNTLDIGCIEVEGNRGRDVLITGESGKQSTNIHIGLIKGEGGTANALPTPYIDLDFTCELQIDNINLVVNSARTVAPIKVGGHYTGGYEKLSCQIGNLELYNVWGTYDHDINHLGQTLQIANLVLEGERDPAVAHVHVASAVSRGGFQVGNARLRNRSKYIKDDRQPNVGFGDTAFRDEPYRGLIDLLPPDIQTASGPLSTTGGVYYEFDPAIVQLVMREISIPKDAAPGQTLRIRPTWEAPTAGTGNFVWGAQINVKKPHLGSVDVPPTTYVAAATPADSTADVLVWNEIVGPAVDPGDKVYINFFRYATDAGDTATAVARLVSVVAIYEKEI